MSVKRGFAKIGISRMATAICALLALFVPPARAADDNPAALAMVRADHHAIFKVDGRVDRVSPERFVAAFGRK